MTSIDRDRIGELFARERERFAATHQGSKRAHERAQGSLLSGVPMNWMTRWPGDFPVFFERAEGAELTDVDGNVYADLCLGDTGAMTGHAPAPTAAAVNDRLAKGITAMLPTEDAAAVGEEMQRRFGLRDWQFSLSATDANRFVIRIARQITGRPKILIHNHCYHGSVDETVANLVDGEVRPRAGSVGPGPDVAETTRVVEINDLEGLERELAEGDVACMLIEPALTNIGIVLADDGYHERVRELTRKHGTLLVIDETHTLCCGPGGYTAAHGLEPDFLTIGKPIGGGIPTGAYGISAEFSDRIIEHTFWKEADVGGVGGTLAGNALSLAAVRATLAEVLTDGGLRADDRARRAVRDGGRRDDRRARAAVVDHPARLPRGVHVLADAAAHRGRGCGGVGRRPRRAAASLHAQPRRPDDPVPHDGADVAGDHRGAGRPPHGGVPGGDRRAHRWLSRRSPGSRRRPPSSPTSRSTPSR